MMAVLQMLSVYLLLFSTATLFTSFICCRSVPGSRGHKLADVLTEVKKEESHNKQLKDTVNARSKKGKNVHTMGDDVVGHILEVNLRKKQKHPLFHGDIVLSEKEEVSGPNGVQNSLSLRTSHLWNYKNASGQDVVSVPYVFDPEVTSSIKKAFREAKKDIENTTCIRLVRRTNQVRYIKIINGAGCYSAVGMQGGMQEVSIAANGCAYKSIVLHELMHVLGWYHEQNRPDRDNYVQIVRENVISTMLHNFDKVDSDMQNTTYDFDSLLHYGPYAFSKNQKPTIIARKQRIGEFGNAKTLSKLDVKSINMAYCGTNAVSTKKPITKSSTKKSTTGPTASTSTDEMTTDSSESTEFPMTDDSIVDSSTTESTGSIAEQKSAVTKPQKHSIPTAKPPASLPTFPPQSLPLPADSAFCHLVLHGGLCRYCGYNKQCKDHCVDLNDNCAAWARAGYCMNKDDIDFMSKLCGGSCRDVYCAMDKSEQKQL